MTQRSSSALCGACLAAVLVFQTSGLAQMRKPTGVSAITAPDMKEWLSYIASDNILGGQIAARSLAKSIGDKGKVYVASTTAGVSTVDQREEGFKMEMKNHPNIQVLQTQRPFVSDLIAGPVTGQLLTTLYVPAKASAIGSFVVAQAFSVDHWKMAAMRPQGRSQWIVAVIDRTGGFIRRNHRTDEFVGKFARPELTAAAAASPDGLIRHSTLEGIEA